MKFQRFSIGLAAATLTMSLSSAWAQDRGRPQNEPASRSSNGETVGSAAPRGGGGNESAAAPASTSSSSPSATAASPANSSAPANSPGSPAWMDPGSPRYFAPRAPIRPDRADRLEAAEQRRGNGGQTTGQAVPRGESGGRTAGSTGSTSSASSPNRSASSGSENQPAQAPSRAVPSNSRPRDGRQQTGNAAERTAPPINGGGGHYPVYPYYPGYVYDPYYSFYYNPYYNNYAYWNPWGYGYGLGYFSYDPFLFGAFGAMSGYGGYYGGGGGYPESYGGGGGGGSVTHYDATGSLRLKIKPSTAQVYIDGNLVGDVDSFDGAFQKLTVGAGPHKVELRAEGYETTAFDVVVTPGDTITYKGDMKRR